MIKAAFYFKNNYVSIHTEDIEDVRTDIKSGFYNCSTDGNGNLNVSMEELPETHIPFASSAYEDIVKYSKRFLNESVRSKIKKAGYLHKMGILLFGKQGSGKTTILNYVAKKVIDNYNGICFLISNQNELVTSIEFARKIRAEQDNPIVFILDEFDTYASSKEGYIKSFLDGNLSIDNSITLCATNYLDRIPNTIKDRPSRIRILREVSGVGSSSLVYDIIKNMSEKLEVNLDEESIRELSKLYVDKTVDEIKTEIIDKAMDINIGVGEKERIGFSSKEKEEGSSIDSFSEFLENIWNSGKEEVPIVPQKKGRHLAEVSVSEKHSNSTKMTVMNSDIDESPSNSTEMSAD